MPVGLPGPGSTECKHNGPDSRRRITFPVTSAAASEARYAITAATSFGVATRRPAERAADAVAASIHPVSVIGGWTMLAVTP